MSDLPFTIAFQRPGDDAALSLRTEDGSMTFTFDEAHYDEATDRLELSAGPDSAAWTLHTLEGHIVHVSAPERILSGLILTDVRRRLLRDGCVSVTFSEEQRVRLDAGDVAHLLTVRRRGGRFRRAS